jgi:hypothetical protein
MPGLLESLTGAGIIALIGLVLRLDKRVAVQNGSVARLLSDFQQHKVENREDFTAVWAGVDALKPRRRR